MPCGDACRAELVRVWVAWFLLAAVELHGGVNAAEHVAVSRGGEEVDLHAYASTPKDSVIRVHSEGVRHGAVTRHLAETLRIEDGPAHALRRVRVERNIGRQVALQR